MVRRFGLLPDEEIKAADQLQKSFPAVGVQPLPPGSPGRVKGEHVGIADPGEPVSFFVFGDHGGVKAPAPQNAVSYAMQRRQKEVSFGLSVGDVVYFNADQPEYGPQFFEPYAKLLLPLVAFPGNHDGDVTDQPGRQPLDTFMAYWCSSAPAIPDVDPQFEYGRHTQTLPWCDWTLELGAVTIIALYSNVPAGGHLEPGQLDWLAQELQAANPRVPVIVGLHHPPYSVDAHHGGSQTMGDALDQAFRTSARTADMVISGHVHNYQRFTRKMGGIEVPYIVSGNGGYHNLHQLASGAAPGQQLTSDVTFEYGDASQYGFVKLTVAGGKISGEYVGVKPGVMPDGSDASITPALDRF